MNSNNNPICNHEVIQLMISKEDTCERDLYTFDEIDHQNIKTEKTSLTCCVCLQSNKQLDSYILPCDHAAHVHCYRRWLFLRNRPDCVLCGFINWNKTSNAPTSCDCIDKCSEHTIYDSSSDSSSDSDSSYDNTSDESDNESLDSCDWVCHMKSVANDSYDTNVIQQIYDLTLGTQIRFECEEFSIYYTHQSITCDFVPDTDLTKSGDYNIYLFGYVFDSVNQFEKNRYRSLYDYFRYVDSGNYITVIITNGKISIMHGDSDGLTEVLAFKIINTTHIRQTILVPFENKYLETAKKILRFWYDGAVDKHNGFSFDLFTNYDYKLLGLSDDELVKLTHHSLNLRYSTDCFIKKEDYRKIVEYYNDNKKEITIDI